MAVKNITPKLTRGLISYPKLAKLSEHDMSRLVHETVFQKCSHPINSQVSLVCEDGSSVDTDYVCTLCQSVVGLHRVPNYASSIDAAFTVLMQLKTEGYAWTLSAREKGVHCLLVNPADTKSIGTLISKAIAFEICVLVIVLLSDVGDSRLTPDILLRYGIGNDG